MKAIYPNRAHVPGKMRACIALAVDRFRRRVFNRTKRAIWSGG
jgi:hypothetical protein